MPMRDAFLSIGAEITRLAGSPHSGHANDSGAVPIGRSISKTPSRSH
jgi:hypothetical protein